jgi:hypothetical protein
MSSRPRKLPLVALVALVVLGTLLLSACGDSHTRVTTGTYAGNGGKAAPYLYVGPLIYQVQLSRQLNPYNSEDAAFLEGVSPAERKLEVGQEWFAVFVQVYNNTSRAYPDASGYTITDTQENVYTPLPLAASNEFAYRPGPVPAKNQIPLPGTTAGSFGTQGALLLFKIQIASLDNRPLIFKIVDPEDPSQSASAELDV